MAKEMCRRASSHSSLLRDRPRVVKSSTKVHKGSERSQELIITASSNYHFNQQPTYQTILTFLTPALLSGVQAGCFTSGTSWGNTAPANDVVQAICTSDGVSGTFSFRQAKSNCHQQHPGTKYDFTVGYVGSADSVTPDDAACKEGLRNEVNACGQGGSTTSGDWSFT
jgi:hypothetical protein